MAIGAIGERVPDTDDAVAALVATEGGACHPHLVHVGGAEASNATLADAVHFLSLLHGRYPGVIDHAGDRLFDFAAREWMYRAAAAFAGERAFLTRLVVAAGPVPSTPRQAQSEAAVIGQMHALAVLSQSDRRGTALGAAFALVHEWPAVRLGLDRAARRFGLQPPPCELPGARDTANAVASVVTTPAIERAALFGVRQLLVQHRGLWDLLQVREGART